MVKNPNNFIFPQKLNGQMQNYNQLSHQQKKNMNFYNGTSHIRKNGRFSKNIQNNFKPKKVKQKEESGIFSKFVRGSHNLLNEFTKLKFKCNCDMINYNSKICSNISRLLILNHASSEEILLQEYNRVCVNYVPQQTDIQLRKDIARTFSTYKYFEKDNSGKNSGFKRLYRLLNCISNYKSIGYLQGMNFIAAAFLYHCEEEYAYFLVKELFR